MLAIFNFLNAHNLPIFHPILMKLVSKFMVHRALSDKTYLLFGLLSPLNKSLSDLSLVWAESPDFILNEGMKGAVQNYPYLRVFVVFVWQTLTNARND